MLIKGSSPGHIVIICDEGVNNNISALNSSIIKRIIKQ